MKFQSRSLHHANALQGKAPWKVHEWTPRKATAKLEAWVEQDCGQCAPLVPQVIRAVAQDCDLDAHWRSSRLVSYNFAAGVCGIVYLFHSLFNWSGGLIRGATTLETTRHFRGFFLFGFRHFIS